MVDDEHRAKLKGTSMDWLRGRSSHVQDGKDDRFGNSSTNPRDGFQVETHNADAVWSVPCILGLQMEKEKTFCMHQTIEASQIMNSEGLEGSL